MTAVGLNDPDPSNNTATDSDTIIVPDFDFGDAPDPAYPTLLAIGGARHLIVPGMYLGTSVDADPDGQPTSGADGDDTDGNDDEEWLPADVSFVAGKTVLPPITVVGSGNLSLWIDANHDGDWSDPDDVIFTDQILDTGTHHFPVSVSPRAAPGLTHARLRFSSMPGLGPTGPAPDGEVEDYEVEIAAQADLLILNSNGQTTSVPGEVVSYGITAINAGPSDAPGSTVTDVFPPELTNCTWTCIPFSDAACAASGTGDISDTVHLGSGSSVTYTVYCTVAPGAVGMLSNTATVNPPAGVPDPIPGNNSATDIDTLTPTVDLSVSKDNTRGEIVESHRTTWGVFVFNTGPSDVVDAHVLDAFPPELTDCHWACIVEPQGGSCTAGPVSGDLDDLASIPSGDFAVYSASCTVAASSGTCDNTVTVSAPAGAVDPDPSDNSFTDSDQVTALADFIFEDGFESGDPSLWSATVPPIVLKSLVREVSADKQRVALRLTLEALEPFGRFEAPVAAGYDQDGERVYLLSLCRDDASFAVRARVWSDDRTSAVTKWVALPHPSDAIELRWRRSLPGLADGRVELYVDGLPPEVIEGLDNDGRGLVATAMGVTVKGKSVTVEE